MKFKDITICLDIAGCPNRCKHCWLGATPNGDLPPDALEWAAERFRPYAGRLLVYDWYREPDFRDGYRERYGLCCKLSGETVDHFELASFWRLVRDEAYAPWLASLGLKKVQLTLFGGEETTDFFIGRKGAYRELLEAMEILLAHRIAPRIQVFVNKTNLGELGQVEDLIRRLELEERCRAFGGEFTFFLHQGSCVGENEDWYGAWITPEDLDKIPASLVAYTLRHFGAADLTEVFGRTEASLYEKLMGDHSTESYVSDSPVFYIDKDFKVYPNISAPEPQWCLGNLKRDGVEAVLENYAESCSPAQHTRLTVPLCELVRSQGDPSSRRLFDKGDYMELMLNRYCRRKRADQSAHRAL